MGNEERGKREEIGEDEKRPEKQDRKFEQGRTGESKSSGREFELFGKMGQKVYWNIVKSNAALNTIKMK